VIHLVPHIVVFRLALLTIQVVVIRVVAVTIRIVKIRVVAGRVAEIQVVNVFILLLVDVLGWESFLSSVLFTRLFFTAVRPVTAVIDVFISPSSSVVIAVAEILVLMSGQINVQSGCRMRPVCLRFGPMFISFIGRVF
jgi:hypothetical protein